MVRSFIVDEITGRRIAVKPEASNGVLSSRRHFGAIHAGEEKTDTLFVRMIETERFSEQLDVR